jgi:hypothetical protein
MTTMELCKGTREPDRERVRDSGTVAATVAAEPACPACEYADGRAWSDPGADYCAGVSRALAAAELGIVRFPFHFCPAHRALVREETQRAQGTDPPKR